MINSTQQQDPAVEKQNVTIDSLSDMTGFPVEFIKKELLLSKNEVCIDELRRSVLDYLQATQPPVFDK